MTGNGQSLGIESILAFLPHDVTSVIVDRILEISPGERILAQKNVTVREPEFSGHFPKFPVYPASAIVELMSQVCCLLAYGTEAYNPSSTILNLVGLNKMKFNRLVRPGDILEVEARLKHRRSNVWRFEAVVYKHDRKVAEGELGLSLQERDNAL